MPGTDQDVRLPGIINMEIEANKLEESGPPQPIDSHCVDDDKVGKLLLNIPLQISIDTCNNAADSAMKAIKRSFSPLDARQRKRTRERDLYFVGAGICSSGKMGQKTRVRSASAGRDKRTEMAAR